MTSKNVKHQHGSAAIVIVTIITIAIIGVLGFVVWQNFIQKDTTAPDASQSTNSQQVSEQSLVLSAWNIEIPLTEDLKGITVEKDDESDSDGYSLYLSKSLFLDDASQESTFNFGGIVRQKADTVVDEDVFGEETKGKTLRELYSQGVYVGYAEGVIIGDYAYGYRHVQGEPFSGDTEKEQEANMAYSAYVDGTFIEVFKKLRSTE